MRRKKGNPGSSSGPLALATLASDIGKVYRDKRRDMRMSHRRFLLIFFVCITALLTVCNLVLIPLLNPSDQQKAAKEQKRARIKRRQQERIERIKIIKKRRALEQNTRFAALTALAARAYQCEEEALPPGSFHIIVAGWKYHQLEGNTGFEPDLNYLVDLGLPNAQIFWYRRMELREEARHYTSSCNISVQEVLTPNTGRDALPFFHHILETWDNPPKAIVMLHGHVGDSVHSSCQGVFARTIYYYRSLARNASASLPMITLVSERNGTKYFDHKLWWPSYEHLRNNASSRRLAHESEIDDGPALDFRRRLNNESSIRPLYDPCKAFHARWKDLIGLSNGIGKRGTCCGTFIVPWNRIKRFPKKFYEDIVGNVMLDVNYSDFWKGRDCYEFVVWSWFGDYNDNFTDEEIANFYEQADGLIHGGIVQQDPALHFRPLHCYDSLNLSPYGGLASESPYGGLASDLLIWLNGWLDWFGLIV